MSPFQKARLVVASISDTYNCHGKKMTNKILLACNHIICYNVIDTHKMGL